MIKSFCESTFDDNQKSKDTTSIILEEINTLAYLKKINGMYKVMSMKKYNGYI